MHRITPEPLTPDAFRGFGSVVGRESANPTAEDDTFRYWSDLSNYRIDGDTEIGRCIVVRRETVDWMERHHQTPEILIPADGPIVLPVMKNGEVYLFRIEMGEAAVIARGVWHSACLPADAAEATYFVLFRRGTPSTDVEKTNVHPVSVNL